MFYDAMMACGNRGEVAEAWKIHAVLICSGLCASTFLMNNLLRAYASCGFMKDALQIFEDMRQPNLFTWNMIVSGYCTSGRVYDARQLFNIMPERDLVSWNVMIAGYIKFRMAKEALALFRSMIKEIDCFPNQFTLSSVLKACCGGECAELGRQLHGFALKSGFSRDLHVENAILDMYVKSGLMEFAAQQFNQMDTPDLFSWNMMIMGYSEVVGVEKALDTFKKCPDQDNVLWNTIISVLCRHGHGRKTLSAFIEMKKSDFEPDDWTYYSVLSACASIPDLSCGRQLHASVIKNSPIIDVYIGAGLVDMYSKCGSLTAARHVFEELTHHNTFSWTCLIAGCVQSGFAEEALLLFNHMREQGVTSDQFTLTTVLGACRSSENLACGSQLHAFAIKLGIVSFIPVSNALVSMYGKCGSIENSEVVFSSMNKKDVISWTGMITAYSDAGYLSSAMSVFIKVPERNAITWNSILAAHINHGHWEEGIGLYVSMQREGQVKADYISFSLLLNASADFGSLRLGNQIFAQMVKTGFDADITALNTVIVMYSKCGKIQEAQKVFESVCNKDLICWNSMISGYAQNGLGKKAIETFEGMLIEGMEPDHITFVSLLSGCSHSGLIHEGRFYFESMSKDHGLVPNSEHYSCMVDLLARSGFVEEAKKVIDEMPMCPFPAIWGAILSACKVHANTELTEYAAKQLQFLDPKHSGSYIQLANLYFDEGKPDRVASIRKTMKERGVIKLPACSWTEAGNNIHVNTADDTCFT